MAFTTQSSRRAAMSDINVTPLVDVMLVLLIIFMVTAPMMQEGVTVDIPRAEGSPVEPDPAKEQIIISVSGPGNIYVNDVPVAESELVANIEKSAGKRALKEVYLRADKTVPYATVVRIIGMLEAAGITHLGLITTRPEEPGTGK